MEGVKIGIPRALQFYFYEDLWLGFFKNLGIETIVSPPSNKEIVKAGVAKSIDEACFSSKIFIGHVEWLLDKCDMIFCPRIENSAIREEYCTRIFGLYDLVRNTFPQAKILNADVNYLYRRREANAFEKIGEQLGFDKETSLAAYKNALAVAEEVKAEKIAQQDELLTADGAKVLIFSHAYNTYDACIGKEITDFFDANGIAVIHADIINEAEAKKLTKETYGKRVYWKVTAQMMGGLEKYRSKVDGIILISTFPCGPDSLFNELVLREIKDKPILSLVIDEQDASAGIQTRLESFTDIITAKRKLRKGGAK
ncbi:MAG: acyl-CoA dehydratase activase-related protein [Defluviitaleaceae bacterium]|nr:acyl-CoA dehydratase activase-related protein [Defluviitaleaceae bacterium]MCL2261710.1 acyl-CoA dehydratase activase-related protein [Defluviitaleaceae bacterium]